MDAMPFTVRRDDFARLRGYVVKRFPPHLEGAAGAAEGEAFDRAFFAYVKAVYDASLRSSGGERSECPSFHSMMGAFLFQERRDSYAWSIRHLHLLEGYPAELGCPRLRVAYHISYWGDELLPDSVLMTGRSIGQPAGQRHKAALV